MTNEDIKGADFIEESNGLLLFLNKKKQLKNRRHKFYPKCSKCLKKKYKKYKINKNQYEDPEVLEVSDIFNRSLDFKGLFKLDHQDSDDLSRPRNYLAKMAKHKKKAVGSPKSKPSNDNNQKKKTDAFKLLMNSRNKSIGSNSPGKADLKVENSEELMIKKANKVKRNLSLQKMAEAKGALKRIQTEEFQEKCIKQKMEKRAKRLKQMITKCNKKDLENGKDKASSVKIESSGSKGNKESENSKPTKHDAEIKKISCADSNPELNLKVVAKPYKSIQKNMLKEDKEFLSKLSPSIRKKENMLSYFKKLESPTENVLSDLDILENDVIKVKLIKKKKKKSKLSLTKCKDAVLNNEKELAILPASEVENIVITDDPVFPTIESNSELDKPRKRKRKLKEIDVNQEEILDRSESTERRSLRTKKKPVRYDYNMSLSSDEDLPIFHLKKAKHGKDDVKSNKKIDETDKMTKLKKKQSKLIKPLKQKPNAKLAPIFVSKTPLDAEALEAKQKFLQSGVPEQLKKIIAQKIITETITANFQKVVHVKQYTNEGNTTVKCKVKLIRESEVDLKNLRVYTCREFLSIDNLKKYPKENEDQVAKSIKQILQGIKESYPDFPVFRTYKTLKNKSKNDLTNNFLSLDNSLEVTLDESEIQDSKMLCWTDKYRATSTQEIFGNFENIKDLRKWLVTWKESNLFTKNSQKSKDSDLSDFCQSDSDSKDSIANSNNLLIVTGPTGCGKTSSIYAVANELSIKVIEVNASSRRTGKILLQDLQEATLSHKVNRGKGSSTENSQNFDSQTQNKQKKTHNKNILSQSKKLLSQISESQNSQENGHTDVSLILIDDADIVFDQDDGFVSGIAQLIHVSKRPVILVTSSLSCQSLQRFSQCSNVIKLHPLSPRILGTWLDILCIADSGLCWPGMGSKILSQNKGDIRKSINYLQFVACSEKLLKNNGDIENRDSQNEDLATDSPDENSNMSWSVKKQIETQHVDINQELDITAYEPSKWNIYDDWREIGHIINSSKISELGNLYDSYSIVDCMSKYKSNDCMNPFYTSEINSVSEKETFEEYNGCNDLASEISRYLIDKSKSNIDRRGTASQSPNADDQREREKIVKRHEVLSSSLVSATVMDRRAIALDYWSLCRSICRIEKQKTDCNSKRNNRFYHYLKTSKVMCKTDVFNKLCRSLQVKDDYVSD